MCEPRGTVWWVEREFERRFKWATLDGHFTGVVHPDSGLLTNDELLLNLRRSEFYSLARFLKYLFLFPYHDSAGNVRTPVSCTHQSFWFWQCKKRFPTQQRESAIILQTRVSDQRFIICPRFSRKLCSVMLISSAQSIALSVILLWSLCHGAFRKQEACFVLYFSWIFGNKPRILFHMPRWPSSIRDLDYYMVLMLCSLNS